MHGYSHGGNAAYEGGSADILDLSSNINPLGMPEGVSAAIIREIPNCERYPDSSSQKLRESIAAFENVDPDRLFCGDGASDIIFRLPNAARAGKIMLTAPAFSDYERSARSSGAEVCRYELSEAGGFAIDDGFVAAVRSEKPDLVYICNPNNPTGRLTAPALIEKLLGCCRETGARVAVDECFLGFATEAAEFASSVFLNEYSNLIIIKAFTKLFALPGIRLGYAICSDREFIERLYLHGADWPVSVLAQAAGIAALEEARGYIGRTVGYVTAERLSLENGLAGLGFKVYSAAANYVFFRNPYTFDLRAELDARGIRIRSCGNYRGLDGSYYRTAVSTKENNVRLLNAVELIIKDKTGDIKVDQDK